MNIGLFLGIFNSFNLTNKVQINEGENRRCMLFFNSSTKPTLRLNKIQLKSLIKNSNILQNKSKFDKKKH